jgi:hypothetical protein
VQGIGRKGRTAGLELARLCINEYSHGVAILLSSSISECISKTDCLLYCSQRDGEYKTVANKWQYQGPLSYLYLGENSCWNLFRVNYEERRMEPVFSSTHSCFMPLSLLSAPLLTPLIKKREWKIHKTTKIFTLFHLGLNVMYKIRTMSFGSGLSDVTLPDLEYTIRSKVQYINKYIL